MNSGPIWSHPVISTAHVVRMTRDYPAGVAWCVATCQCGWSFRAELGLGKGAALRDEAAHEHWRDVVAQAVEQTP
jgi:hypothetical protein